MATSTIRRAFGGLLALLVPALAIVALAGPSQAADAYRYWNYFHVQDGQYTFATTGPGDYTPKDGSTEAYRYGTSAAADGIPPRADLATYTFDAICEGSTAKPDQKRVALILDYGTPADAPSGETPPEPRTACAVVPAKANGQQTLDAVADVRVQDFLCGIDGYPATDCSVTVKNAPPQATEQPVDFVLPQTETDKAADSTDSGSDLLWPLVGVGAAVVVLGGAGLALSRRNKAA